MVWHPEELQPVFAELAAMLTGIRQHRLPQYTQPKRTARCGCASGWLRNGQHGARQVKEQIEKGRLNEAGGADHQHRVARLGAAEPGPRVYIF